MNVVVVTEYRFRNDGAGQIVSTTRTRGYSFWKRYLSIFDSVYVVGRLDTSTVEEGEVVEGEGVRVIDLPQYSGPRQFLIKSREIRSRLRRLIPSGSAIIVRLPGVLGGMVYWHAKKEGRPYGVELVGDPLDVFARGAVRHPLRPILRGVFARLLRHQVRGAAAVSYVTEEALQNRYPTSSFSVSASSVELPESAFVVRPRTEAVTSEGAVTLLTIGSLAQPYKGVDVLIKTLVLLRRSGIDARLRIMGDGRYQSDYEELAASLGVQEYVEFLGRIPAGEPVRQKIDEADIFVMASRSEGLPRAMIEAMARGLPCVGTDVGGIPELLSDEFLVPVNDVEGMVRKVTEIINKESVDILEISRRNIHVARRYRASILTRKRMEFYSQLVKETAAWQSTTIVGR